VRKKLGYLSEIIILIFVILVWIFSFYKVVSYVASLNLKVWGFVPRFGCFPICPPPFPPEPPCPPPCVTPTPPVEPTPTLPPEVTPTPTPTLPPGVTPTPTSPPGEGGPPGPGEAPVCGATIPLAPTLLSATKSGSEADLTWTAVSPVTHYSISYGLSSGNYIYGVSNTGNVTSFAVGGLDPAATYCFAVRGVNDCAPSGLSNEICTGEVLGVGQVLGVTTLAETGSFTDEMFYVLFIIGSVCTGVGLRLFLPCPAKPAFGERSGTAKKLV